MKTAMDPERNGLSPEPRGAGTAAGATAGASPRLAGRIRRAPGAGTVAMAPHRWATAATAIVWLGSGCHGSDGESTRLRPTDDVAPIRVRTATATAVRLPATLDVNGALYAERQSEVTSVVPGRVMEVPVRRGDVVAEGAPLVRLRDVDYRLKAATARPPLQQAQARLGMDGRGPVPRPEDTAEVHMAMANRDLAEDALRRAERLAEQGALAQAELDRARAQAAAARAQYEQAVNGMRTAIAALAQARVATAQASTAVRESVVRAPLDGEIAEVFVDPGEYVAPQMPVVSLVSTRLLRLALQVPQEHVAAVRRGQPVQVRVSAYPDRVFRGVVRRIGPALRPDTRALTVEAEVSNEDGALRPGMFARARIELGGDLEGVRVPLSAVVSESGSHRVFVIGEGDAIEERVVTLVERGVESAVLSDGLRPGERVATTRTDRLTDGTRVAVDAAR